MAGLANYVSSTMDTTIFPADLRDHLLAEIDEVEFVLFGQTYGETVMTKVRLVPTMPRGLSPAPYWPRRLLVVVDDTNRQSTLAKVLELGQRFDLLPLRS